MQSTQERLLKVIKRYLEAYGAENWQAMIQRTLKAADKSGPELPMAVQAVNQLFELSGKPYSVTEAQARAVLPLLNSPEMPTVAMELLSEENLEDLLDFFEKTVPDQWRLLGGLAPHPVGGITSEIRPRRAAEICRAISAMLLEGHSLGAIKRKLANDAKISINVIDDVWRDRKKWAHIKE
jgi:hypothetical protein